VDNQLEVKLTNKIGIDEETLFWSGHWVGGNSL